uniref:probable LRR receptor-like serine/threonine-protein kinase At3g47570 n=1 Tax=Erigeron canadensis TaxID=72917 RepID=UPI001CB89BDF|nr:probable LRR receptor-like serine/threonine-protein kinase At3g47570 [Erigeron canadensis]
MISLASLTLISIFSYTLVIFPTTFATITGSHLGNESDHMALLSFKSFIGDPYGALASWNSSSHFCKWGGVSCGKHHKRVTVIQLESEGLQGSLSPHVGNLSFLRMLSLGNNSFEGTIPHELGRLSRLRILYLYQNKFNGVIPINLSSCYNLKFLSLARNKLVGSIPVEISFLSKLIFLSFNYNNLTGGFPPFLGNLTLMKEFQAIKNPLGGRIPHTLGRWKSLRIFNAGECNLHGTIPHSIYNLSLLTNFSLAVNQLTGTLPPTTGSMLLNLRRLVLRDNQLSGLLPMSISNCSRLDHLEMSDNNFSGKLMIDFANLKDISYIALMNNDFNGGGADELKFSIDSMGNCTKLEKLGIGNCNIEGVVPTTIGLVYAWFKKKKNGQQSQSSTNERFLKVSYDQILKATDGFSQANLIGQGGSCSVYKGILDHDPKFVAVKVLHLQIRGAHKSFITECEAWRSIRHRNLLKIITSCSSIDFQGNDFKALVYEFMPNGSLHDWLHSNANTSRLNLFQRINILIDIASALDYLHNQCLPTIVHGDIKPSNILLDNDMVAHVGDFGLAKFLGINSNQNNSTGVKGTIGYAPPEYGLGSKMTSSGDVYSFGILLLEVMTGKKPTDDIFNEDLSLHKFAYVALLDQIIDIIDSDVVVMQNTEANAVKMEECLTSTIRIGVSCSIESPSQRMNISNVLHELLHVRGSLQNLEV